MRGRSRSEAHGSNSSGVGSPANVGAHAQPPRFVTLGALRVQDHCPKAPTETIERNEPTREGQVKPFELSEGIKT